MGQVLFNHALLGLALGVGLLIAVFGWEIGLIAAGVHASLYLLGGGAINGIGHKWGKRPHDNLATNNQWLAWLVAGEGLHNNHHAVTTSSRMSMAKGEVDPGWWAILCWSSCAGPRCATRSWPSSQPASDSLA